MLRTGFQHDLVPINVFFLCFSEFDQIWDLDSLLLCRSTLNIQDHPNSFKNKYHCINVRISDTISYLFGKGGAETRDGRC